MARIKAEMKHRPENLDPQFDSFAKDYDAVLNEGLAVSGEHKEYFAAGRLRWVRHRLAALDLKAGKVLDYGCGTGASTPLLLSICEADEVAGVEVSSRSIEVARKYHDDSRLTFRLVEDYSPRAEFDLAYCNGVFHHIPPADRPAALDYIFRSLRPGAVFAFFENNPWNPGTRLIMSRIPFDRDAIKVSPFAARKLLRAGGFEVVATDYLFFFPRVLAWLRNWEPWLRAVPLGAQYLVLARKPAPSSECD